MFYFLSKTFILNGRHNLRAPPSFHKLGFLQNPSLLLKYTTSSSNQHSYAVSYLINTLGFTPQAALSASKYVNFETAEKADNVISFFNNHGFSQTQISALVRRFPRVLLCDPEKTLLPKLEFLTSKGISSDELAKFLSGSPLILKSSLEKQVIPSFEFFKDLLQCEKKTIHAIKRFSAMLTFDLETYVAPNINLLRVNGVPESNIITLLEYQPRSLVLNSARFKEIVEEVKEMGFNPLRSKFLLAVFALRAMSKSTWERKVDAYKKWGWSEEEVLLAFGRNPWCMMASEVKITGVMDFFINKMGLESSCVLKQPALVCLSLEKRLIPRGEVFHVLLSKGLVKKNVSLAALFKYPEKSFLQKFILPHKDEATELLKLYKEKLDLSK